MRHQKKRYTVARSKYAKIPLKIKLKFLRKIISEGFSIRDVNPIWISRPPFTTSTTRLPRPSCANTGPIASRWSSTNPATTRCLSSTTSVREFVAVTAALKLRARANTSCPSRATTLAVWTSVRMGCRPRSVLARAEWKAKSNPRWSFQSQSRSSVQLALPERCHHPSIF